MPTPITKITTHSADGQARAPGWLKNATNFLAFIDTLIQPSQTIEDLLIQLVDETDIDNGVGAQLDVIGVILDLPRSSATEPDAEYRIRLHARGGQLGRSGEPESVIVAFLNMTSANSVLLVELQPASIELYAFVDSDAPDPIIEEALINSMNQVIAAGIGSTLFIQEENAFLWGFVADASITGDVPIDADHGLGDEANADANGDITPGPGQGGNFARVLI